MMMMMTMEALLEAVRFRDHNGQIYVSQSQSNRG